MNANELRSFRFTIFELGVTHEGTGTVIDTGITHDGYCDDSVCRLRVVESKTYAPGEVIVVNRFNTRSAA